MRWLWALVLAFGCTEPEQPVPFEYSAIFSPSAATVIVDGVPDPGELTYSFADYETARRELVLEVVIKTGTMMGTVEIRPGVCWDRILPGFPEIGRLVGERVTYEVLDAPPTVAVYSHICEGTELSVVTTP